jgi:hypothetical protein
LGLQHIDDGRQFVVFGNNLGGDIFGLRPRVADTLPFPAQEPVVFFPPHPRAHAIPTAQINSSASK